MLIKLKPLPKPAPIHLPVFLTLDSTKGPVQIPACRFAPRIQHAKVQAYRLP